MITQRSIRYLLLVMLACHGFLVVGPATAAPPTSAVLKIDTQRGDKMIAEYFRRQTAGLANDCLKGIDTLEQWQQRRGEYRNQLLEMLGLFPLPARTDLQATVTGKTEHTEFIVEHVHFQSRPGLYVTGNLYRPKNVDKPLPAVLYVCGHGGVKKNGISYGNKVHYHHHGAWFARNGYVCLIIDSLQLGEIEAIHHGTYRYKMWWWLNRGYTPAGVEAWNCVRALDYLQTRDEVDDERFGVTGRSGGGIYSWWIAAIDDRIKAAVPVAGITDLENYVIDGCVERHCDCMFMLNTYRWDYPLVAALVAPRPLLISNTDSDDIFPLDGVVRTFEKVRQIYALYDAKDKVALNITAGPHQDTQELRVHAFRWLNQHLQNGTKQLLDKPAYKYFQPEQLRVFTELPKDQTNTTIHKTFVPIAMASLPADSEQWQKTKANWTRKLLEKSFAGWPTNTAPPTTTSVFSVERNGIQFQAMDFASQQGIGLRLYIVQRAGLKAADLTVLNVMDQQRWQQFLSEMRCDFAAELKDETLPPADLKAFTAQSKMLTSFPWAMAYMAPRGIGPTTWDQSERKQTQHRRRFYLLGQSLEGMQVWDVRRALQVLRGQQNEKQQLWIQAYERTAGIALYASIFEPNIERLDLHQLPTSHRNGPIFLNVRRILDMPQAVALAANNTQLVLYDTPSDSFRYPQQVAKQLNWDAKQLQFRQPN